ncbi:MAG TPA: hypothetical protein VKD72_03575, partial [Gemmataceae bacterium]|nr:hypothetical protein [Gemmataceae bacterium]
DLRGFECWFWDRLGHAELRSLRGHQSRVMSLVFSPDGKHLTSTEYYGKVILWDVSTGAPLRTVPGQRQPAGCSPDGKWIAAPGAGNTIRIWELASGRDVVTLNGPAPPAGLPVFSPDGKRLAVPCRNGNLQVWDTRGGRTPLTIEMKGTGPQPEAARLAFSPDGKLLACGDREGSVAVWDTGTGAEVYTLKAHPALVTGLAFSPDGRRLASGGFDRAVRLWDAATGKELLTFRGHADAVEGVAFSPDGRRAASAGRDNTILVWDVASGQELVALKADAHGIYNLAFSPDGQRLASAGIDGALGGSQTIKIWDPVCGVQSLALHPSDRTLDVLHTRDGTPTGSIAGAAEFVFSPDGTRMASIDGSAVRVWDAADGRQLLTLKGHADKVTRVIFSPQSSRRLASVGSDGILKVWDISAGAPPAAAEKLVIRVGPPVGFLGEEHFRALDFSPDSRRLASGTARGEVKVWDADDGKELLSILAHPGFGVTRVAFSPDGKRLASTCAGHQPLKLWDLDTRRQVLSFRGPGEKPWFTGLSFSPDGRRVATCYLVGGGQVWDAATGEVSFPLSRDASRILGLAYSPDGKRLATLGVNAVKVLDATNGNELLTLPGGFTSKGGTAVAFSPDSRRLAVGDRIWDARPWTDELRARRQALGLYRLAVEKWLLKDEVRQCIREQAGVSDAVRQHALALADCYAENPTRLLHASKEVLLKPGAGPEEYRRALRRLEAVFRLQPQMLPHHEHYLGVARYRLGQYPEALKVLAKIEYRINRPGEPDRGFRHPEGAPFLAMTRHRLGQKEEARATLDGFRGHIARVEAGLKKFELPAGVAPQRKAENERQQKIAVRQLTLLKELLREAEGCIGGPPRSEKKD